MSASVPFTTPLASMAEQPGSRTGSLGVAMACGVALGTAIAVLEFAYYYPLVSSSHRLGGVALWSAFLTWSGESVILSMTVAFFERRGEPGALSALSGMLAAVLGSVAGVLLWQAFTHFVLREHFGMLLFRDHLGLAQPVNWPGTVLYHVWMLLIFGGLTIGVYSSRQRHARMLEGLRTTELRRERSQQALAQVRLAGLRSRVNPEFVFDTLTKLERLYQTDVAAAERLLEELIVFLREAKEAR
jgi:hypothetical protein